MKRTAPRSFYRDRHCLRLHAGAASRYGRVRAKIKSVLGDALMLLVIVVVFTCIYAAFAWDAAIDRLRSEGREK